MEVLGRHLESGQRDQGYAASRSIQLHVGRRLSQPVLLHVDILRVCAWIKKQWYRNSVEEDMI